MPFSILCHQPRMPLWDAMSLLLNGTIALLSSDAETVSIKNQQGQDLSVYGAVAQNSFRTRKHAEGFFTRYHGLDSLQSSSGEFWLQMRSSSTSVNTYGTGDFIHNINGKREGKINYLLKRGLSELLFNAEFSPQEKFSIEFKKFGMIDGVTSIISDRNKQVSLQLNNRIGVGKDRLSISIGNLPVNSQSGVQLNLKPGLAGFEVSSLHNLEIPLKLEAFISGRKIVQNFNLPLSNGINKVNLSGFISTGNIGISQADGLFSVGRNFKLINPSRFQNSLKRPVG